MNLPEELMRAAERFAEHAARTGRRVATAESCTGGLLAAALTEIPGSSEWFLGGIVSYSVSLKKELLGVSPDTIERYGVVSVETAAEMARGLVETTGCTTAASVTGLAGPGGGEEGLPVGTVCFAWVDSRAGEKSRRAHFPGGRAAVRAAAAIVALEGLLELP